MHFQTGGHSGIYAGWFTATESGAIGALGAFILALARRKLTWAGVWKDS